MRDIKCVICGDGAVGKTCVISVYSEGVYPEEYVPTVLENFYASVVVDKKLVQLVRTRYLPKACYSLTGTPEAYDRLRPLSYPHTDVFILCFSVDNFTSLSNIEKKWFPEVQHYCPGVPIILCGTKIDIRDSELSKEMQQQSLKQFVSTEQGKQMARNIGAAAYCECSALLQKGVKQVFEEAIRAVLSQDSGSSGKLKRKIKCSIL